MNLPPVHEILRKRGIRFVANSNGAFRSNCPECGRPTSNLVELDGDGLGARWRCDCGFSGAERVRAARGQTDGRGVPGDDDDEAKRKLEEARRELGEEPEQEGAPAPEPEPKRDEPEPEPKPTTIAEAARTYHARGWKPVPISRKTKRAIGKEWQKRPYDPKQFDGNAQNVGVQLGKVSGGLTDVDLDCAEAIGFAPAFLPTTGAIFGRQSKPASHQLYITDLCESEVGAVISYAEYIGGKPGPMIVELRVGGMRKGESKGATSVFPPSLHETGEAVTWVRTGAPANVGGDELMHVVRKLAVASLLKRHYSGVGSRHDGARVIGGVLARAAWNAADIAHVVEQAARAVGDDEVTDRGTTAKGAVEVKANGDDVAGFDRLRSAWGDVVADTLAHWLKVRALRPDKGVGIEDRVALDLATKHADHLRYIGKSGMWMRWSGNRWQEEATTSFAYDEARKLCRPAGDARAKTVNAVTVHARTDRRIAATAEQWNVEKTVFNPKKAKE